jgi:integrase/recombinase XerD
MDTGLRISEAISLKLEDIDWNRNSVKVMGKGSKERIVPFGRAVRKALMAYLDRRGNLDTDMLFVTEYGETVRRQKALEAIKALGKKAGITGVRVSPHTLRHTFAKTFLVNGGDPFTLQQILGHTTLDMTRKYIALANSDLQTAHSKYSPADKLLPPNQEKAPKRKRLK